MHLVLSPLLFPKKKLDRAIIGNDDSALIRQETYKEFLNMLTAIEKTIIVEVSAIIKVLCDLAKYFHTSPKGLAKLHALMPSTSVKHVLILDVVTR